MATTKPFQGGLFSAPITNAVGDPYVDKYKTGGRPHGSSKGIPQFGISMKGIPGKFNRLYEGEQYMSASKLSAMDRMDGRKKFLTPNGFRYSSPLKKSSSKGDFNGTFRRKAPPYESDGTYGQRGVRTALKETGPRNFFTNPPRKATGEAKGNTPKVCFDEYRYVSSDYDAFRKAEREARLAEKEKYADRVPFKIVGQDALDAKPKEEDENHAKTAPARIAPIKKNKKGEGEEEEQKAFRPSSPSKSGGALYGTFSKYPKHEADPFDEKKILRASMSGRLLPMATQYEGLDERLKERRPWAPSSPPKQMFTKSTMFSKE